jgi:hypothetical protein
VKKHTHVWVYVDGPLHVNMRCESCGAMVGFKLRLVRDVSLPRSEYRQATIKTSARLLRDGRELVTPDDMLSLSQFVIHHLLMFAAESDTDIQMPLIRNRKKRRASRRLGG